MLPPRPPTGDDREGVPPHEPDLKFAFPAPLERPRLPEDELQHRIREHLEELAGRGPC